MSALRNTDFLVEVAKGKVPGHSLVHKFGHAGAIGTSLVPIALGNIYPTPSAAVSLEFISSAAADALASTGMHELTIVGLDANWEEQTVVVAAHATTGLTAVAITGTWMRMYRAYVSSSGTYATASGASHAGTITIRIAGAGATYGIIETTDFPVGQTQIGAYTVPLGYTAFFLGAHFHNAAAKNVDLLAFHRDNANDVTASYSGTMRVFYQAHDISSDETLAPRSPLGGFTGSSDIGFMAKVASGTGSASIDFELLIVDNNYL